MILYIVVYIYTMETKAEKRFGQQLATWKQRYKVYKYHKMINFQWIFKSFRVKNPSQNVYIFAHQYYPLLQYKYDNSFVTTKH